MGCVTIVSGSPGSGKSTLCARLAAALDNGLHFETDLFYGFPAHPIDPTRPEAHAQNTTLLRAIGGAAAAFAEGGYAVYLDGIVGPWFLPTLLAALPDSLEVEYVILEVPLPLALARVRQRVGSGESARVAQMHRAFRELGEHAARVLDASAGGPEALEARFHERRASGCFRVARP